MRQIRTDMAMESAREAGDMPGVKVSGWENAGIHVTEVQLTDPDSAQKLGKPVGNLYHPGIRGPSPPGSRTRGWP